jgi:hypothetical protein
VGVGLRGHREGRNSGRRQPGSRGAELQGDQERPAGQAWGLGAVEGSSLSGIEGRKQ